MSISVLDNNTDLVKRNLIVLGVSVTNNTSESGVVYDYCNLTCLEKLKGNDAFGYASPVYRFGTHQDITKFAGCEPPFMIQAETYTVASKDGKKTDTVIQTLDFTSIKNLDLVIKRQKPQSTNDK